MKVFELGGVPSMPRALTLQAFRALSLQNKYIRELSFLIIGYFLYLGIKNFILNEIDSIAFANANKVIRFERLVGLFWEPDIQQWLIEHAKGVILFFNWFYSVAFFPVLIPTAIFVFLFRYRTYVNYRNVFLISLAFTWVLYTLFPLAPPRLVPWEGFVDTIQAFGPAIYNTKETISMYNQYSAMPSMHFGWTLLFAVMFYRTRKLPLRIIAVLYPVLFFISIIVTANHYILDPIVGGLIILGSFYIYAFFTRTYFNRRSSLLLQRGDTQE